jgi:hypothetical protein
MQAIISAFHKISSDEVTPIHLYRNPDRYIESWLLGERVLCPEVALTPRVPASTLA